MLIFNGGSRQDKEPSGSPLAASIEATTPPEPRKRMSRKVTPAIHKAIHADLQKFTNRFMGLFARDTYKIAYLTSFVVALAGIIIKDPEVLRHIDEVAQKDARVHCQTRSPQIEAIFQELKNVKNDYQT